MNARPMGEHLIELIGLRFEAAIKSGGKWVSNDEKNFDYLITLK